MTAFQREEDKKRKRSDIDLRKSKYAEQAKKMFFHAYNNYMVKFVKTYVLF